MIFKGATKKLAAQIQLAVTADELGGGCDISAGLFGPHFSQLIAELADRRKPVDPKPRMTDEQVQDEWVKAGGRVDRVEGLSLMLTGEYLVFRRDLDAKIVALAECVSRLKRRIHFIGWPGESYFNAGSDKYDWWVPDWRYEIALIENVLHGSPVDQPEKPTDTTKAIELKRAARRGYRNLPTPLDAGDTYPQGPHSQDYVAGHNKVLAQVTEAMRENLGQPAARKFSAWVGDMKTSAGMDYYVCVGYGPAYGEYLTSSNFKIRGRAEYEVAEWNHLFGRCEKPDILAFGPGAPTADPAVESLPNAEDGDFDCPKAAAVRACACGFCAALRRPAPAEHVLYAKDDVDAPDSIKDRNGDIMLALCRNCGRAESDLVQPCFGIPCEDCPPADYPTDKTRCAECPRREANPT